MPRVGRPLLHCLPEVVRQRVPEAFRMMGPAFLVSVAYLDPGNWATAIEAGSRFGYQLIWILVLSNLIAILLQTLAARLGLVTGKHLAQVNSKPMSVLENRAANCCFMVLLPSVL